MRRLQRLFLVLLTALLGACEKAPELTIQTIYQPGVEHPSDITHYQGKWVITELYNKRLVVIDSLDNPQPSYLPKPGSKQKLRSPHFFEVDDLGRLWASEGWGKGLVRFDSLAAQKGKKIRNPQQAMRAPHGLCIKDGWIYVADSLNSRLIRARTDALDSWQTFSDTNQLIAYGRALECHADGLYLANSYEKREGLNSGSGSNVLRITDFESGKVDVLFSQADTFSSGLLKLNERYLLISQWVPGLQLVLVDLKQNTRTKIDHPGSSFFAPYGIHHDQETDIVYVTYVGDIHNKQHKGGIVAYKLNWRWRFK